MLVSKNVSSSVLEGGGLKVQQHTKKKKERKEKKFCMVQVSNTRGGPVLRFSKSIQQCEKIENAVVFA